MNLTNPARNFSHLVDLAEEGDFRVDRKGRNVLHALCEEEGADMDKRIKTFLDAGCNFLQPNSKDYGATPFATAIALQHDKVIELFLYALEKKYNVSGLQYAFKLLYEPLRLPVAPKSLSVERLNAAQRIVDSLVSVATSGGQRAEPPVFVFP